MRRAHLESAHVALCGPDANADGLAGKLIALLAKECIDQAPIAKGEACFHFRGQQRDPECVVVTGQASEGGRHG